MNKKSHDPKLYLVATIFYNSAYINMQEEKENSANEQDLYIEPFSTFFAKFCDQFNLMYTKTLETLNINSDEIKDIAGEIEYKLLEVLSEETGTNIIDSKTHQMNLTTCFPRTISIAEERIKNEFGPKKFEKNSIDRSSEINSTTNDLFQQESQKNFFDKWINDYNSLSTKKEKLQFIENNILDSAISNISNDKKTAMISSIDIYLTYKNWKAEMLEKNPDLSKEELHKIYLKENPEIDSNKFEGSITLAKTYVSFEISKKEFKEMKKFGIYTPEEKILKKNEFKFFEKALSNSMKSLGLSEKDIKKLSDCFKDEIDSYEEYNDYEDYENFDEYDEYEDEIIIFNIENDEQFRQANTTYTDLLNQYRENPSNELEKEILRYQESIGTYSNLKDLIDEDVYEIDELIEDEDVYEITENRFTSFFKNISKIFNQPKLDDADHTAAKNSLFSRIKSRFSHKEDQSSKSYKELPKEDFSLTEEEKKAINSTNNVFNKKAIEPVAIKPVVIEGYER